MGIEKFSREEIRQIRQEYREAKNKNTQVGILAELHATDKKTIVEILQMAPEDLLKLPAEPTDKTDKVSGYGASKKAAYALLGGMSREEVLRQYEISYTALNAAVKHYRPQYMKDNGKPADAKPKPPARKTSAVEKPAEKPATSPEKRPSPANRVILDRTVTAAISYTGSGGLQVNGVPINELFEAIFAPMSVDGLALFAGRLHILIEDINEGQLIPERIGPVREETQNHEA